MGGLFELLWNILLFIGIVVCRIVVWIAVNFCRAIYQAVFPHPDFEHWSLF